MQIYDDFSVIKSKFKKRVGVPFYLQLLLTTGF